MPASSAATAKGGKGEGDHRGEGVVTVFRSFPMTTNTTGIKKEKLKSSTEKETEAREDRQSGYPNNRFRRVN